jgi:signal transduction histidine kinase/CheY-like chemotaxis protein
VLLVWALVAEVAAAAAALAVVVADVPPLVGAPFRLEWWALAPVFCAAEILVVRLPLRREALPFTLAEIPLVFGLFFAGPDDLVLGRVVGVVVALALTRPGRSACLALTASVAALEASLAAALFHTLAADSLDARTAGAAALALLVATLAAALLVQAGTALSRGTPALRDVARTLGIDLLVAVANTSLALVGVVLVWREPQLAFLVVPLAAVLFLGYRAYVSARRRNDALTLLYETSRMLHGTAEFETALGTLLAQARAAFGAELAALTLVPANAGDGMYRAVLGAGSEHEPMRFVDEPLDPLLERGLVEGVAVRSPARSGASLQVAGIDVGDALLAPLRGDGGVLGTILVANRPGSPQGFGRDDLLLFETLANHAAIALEATRLDRELTQLTEALAERRRLERHLRQAQRLESVGRLAGGIAHEFNNLLTAIAGYGELLLTSVDGDERRHVEEINAASARAATLTRQLLAFGRKQVARPVILDLNEVVEQLHGAIRSELADGIDLVTDLEPGVVPVRADRALLQEALLNLAANAREAMPDGGTLTIRTEDVDVAAVSPGEVPMPAGRYALVSVSDNGRGMDESTRAQAFEPFFTTKGIGEGPGLGLASVYGFVKQSGGFIFVRSRPGAGARFDVYLPDVKAPHSAPALPAPSSQHPTVLLVEDEPDLRTAIRELLERGGCTVLDAADASEALTLSTRFQGDIQLLVTGADSSAMSAAELHDLLVHERPGLRVLTLSGSLDADARELLSAGRL